MVRTRAGEATVISSSSSVTSAAASERPGDGLALLGLRPGETVRWRSAAGGRWRPGKVARRERDGSVGVTDAAGSLRSLPVERLEVRRPGPRGGSGWEPLSARASRSEQLKLL